MAQTLKTERRYLSGDELELVEKYHHPGLRHLSDEEVDSTLKILRERRDRARDIASRQRREMRGKSDSAGARLARDDSGSRKKTSLLGAALKRLKRESERRRIRDAGEGLIAAARRALALRRAKETRHHPAPGRSAGEGMRPKPNDRAPRIADPMEAGRVSQFVKDAQARRDAR